MDKRKDRTFRLAILGVITAILIIQTFIPIMGYLPIPPLNPTIVHITVIVGGIILGPKNGMLLGTIWGLLSLTRAYVAPNSPVDIYVVTNPLISVLPRIFVGLFAAWYYRGLRRITKKGIAQSITGVLGSLTNTILFLGAIYIFMGETYADLLNVDISNLRNVLLVIVGTNGIGEAILAGVVVPLISRPLKHFEERLNPMGGKHD